MNRIARGAPRWLRRARWGVVCLFLPVGAHYAIHLACRLVPPEVELPAGEMVERGPTRAWGRSYATPRGAILEVRLAGTPEEIGYAHARLVATTQREIEGVLYERFREVVPWSIGRLLLVDVALVRFRRLDQSIGATRKRELGAAALGMSPDSFSDFMPTFQRLVYLNSLYDISLSFENSPLVGCTTFVLSGDAVQGGHTLLARAFDFEVDEVFDRRKAVFLVEESGSIPFASVSWPGMIGVLSGMNAEGVAVVVHGARAGPTVTDAEPVTLALRRVLSTAHDTDEAILALRAVPALVSHLVIVADARGRGAVVERVPPREVHVRWLPSRAAVTNHFEGPAASDPKNERVRATSSTLARRQRADELLRGLAAPVTVREAVQLLRERRGPGNTELALGDRRAIDALIATHGVVMDTTDRVLWVSEGPHLLGRFLAFDLKRLLKPNHQPDSAPPQALDADPFLTSGEYARWRAEHPTTVWH